MKIISLFSGIGAPEKALERFGVDTDLQAWCEIDKFAPLAYKAIHSPSVRNSNDVSEFDGSWYERADILTHGSPCQDFSVSGNNKGGDVGSGTRSSLMWETVRVVEENRPRVVLWEQVPNVLSKKHRHNFDRYIEEMEWLGYESVHWVLNATDYGIPQNRKRVFTVSVLHGLLKAPLVEPPKKPLSLRLADLLDDEVDPKYYLKPEQLERLIFKPNFEKLMRGVLGIVQDENKNSFTGDGSRVGSLRVDGENLTINTQVIANVNPSGKGMNGNVYAGNAPTITTNKGQGPKVLTQVLTQVAQVGDKDSQATRVYSDSVASTLSDGGGLGAKTGLYVRNATASGYLEAREGDGVILDNPDSKTKRGRVQKGKAPTLLANDQVGTVCRVIGELDRPGWFKDQREIRSAEGTAPTVIAGYGMAGNKTLKICRPIINPAKPDVYQNGRRVKENGEPSFTVTATDRHGVVTREGAEYCIRKLTPLECWRLMGFDDEDFAKAKATGLSDSQLCKQAGNSIVVDVLEAVFAEVLKKVDFEKEM